MVSTLPGLNRWQPADFLGFPASRQCWPPPGRLVILPHHGGTGRSRRTGAPLPGPVARPDDGACQRSGDGRGDRADAPPHGLRAAGRGDLGPRRHGDRQPVGERAGLAAGDASQRRGRRPGRCPGRRSAGRRCLGLADGDDGRAGPGGPADAGRLARCGRRATRLAAAELGRAARLGPVGRGGSGLVRRGLAGRGLAGRWRTGCWLAGRWLDAAAPRGASGGPSERLRRLGRIAGSVRQLGAAAGLESPPRLGPAAAWHHRSDGQPDGRRPSRHTGGAGERR